MTTSRALALFTVCCLCTALAAQGDKPQKQKADKDAAATKDDAITANDKAIVAADKFIAKNKVDTKADGWRTRLPAPELLTFDQKHDYFWHLDTTQGEITFQLLVETAPMHVTNIVYLTRRGFYDSLTFHRVIQRFMAQGGCPNGVGNGGPGYTIDGEHSPDVKHDGPGVLSTANTGQPKSDGSQFFITFGPTPHLNGKHTISGRVTAGMDVVKAIEKNGSEDGSGKTKVPMSIKRAWIAVTEKPKAPAAPVAPVEPKKPGK